MANALNRWFKTPTLGDQLRAAGVREDFCTAVERTPFARQGNLQLVQAAANISDDEHVVQLFEGRGGGHEGLLILTSQRLLFLPGTRLAPIAIPLADVLAVNARVKRGMSSMEIVSSAGTTLVDRVLGNQCETMATNVRSALQPGAAVTKRDPLVELGELRALHAAGAIDDSEYAIRKQRLVGEI